ncbi:MAG: DNA methyltransferase [Planctomycetota bacterium]
MAKKRDDNKSKFPSKRNELNDLISSKWLYFTNTLWETTYPPDVTHKIRKSHGAMKPPEVMRDLILFFSKKGELILDPFAGVGGTLLGAELAQRKALGFELNPSWIKIYEDIKTNFAVKNGELVNLSLLQGEKKGGSKKQKKMFPDTDSGILPLTAKMEHGDCLQLIKTLDDNSVHAVICDPPYGIGHKATGFKNETNFSMYNLDDSRDFGNAASNADFFNLMKQLAHEVFRVLKPKRYFVVMVGDRLQNSEYFPLGINLANELRKKGFQLKGIKIWWNKTTLRPLKPYGINRSFVSNITHHNIIILKRISG